MILPARRLVWLLAASLLSAAQVSDFQRAKHKLESLDKAPPGSQVVLSEQELNAYIAGLLPRIVGEGAVHSSRLTLLTSAGVIRLRVDFLRLQANTGREPGWLMQRLLQGVTDVEAAGRVASDHGSATFWLDRVQVAGIPVSGGALDFLLQTFIAPEFPGLKIGKPFPLLDGIDHFDVSAGSVRIFVRR